MTSLYDCMKPFATMFYLYGHDACTSARPPWPLRLLHCMYRKSLKPNMVACLVFVLFTFYNVRGVCLDNFFTQTGRHLLVLLVSGNFLTVASHAACAMHEKDIYSCFDRLRFFFASHLDAIRIKRITLVTMIIMTSTFAIHFLCFMLPFAFIIMCSIFAAIEKLYKNDDDGACEIAGALIAALPVMWMLCKPMIPSDNGFLALGLAFNVISSSRMMFNELKQEVKHEQCTHAAVEKVTKFFSLYVDVKQLLDDISLFISPLLHAALVVFLMSISFVPHFLLQVQVETHAHYIFIVVISLISTPVLLMLFAFTLLRSFQLNKEVEDFLWIYHKTTFAGSHPVRIMHQEVRPEGLATHFNAAARDGSHLDIELAVQRLNHMIFVSSMELFPLRAIRIDWLMEVDDLGLFALMMTIFDIVQLSHQVSTQLIKI